MGYQLLSHAHETYVDDVRIHGDVFSEELVGYKVEDKEDLLETLLDWISEASPSDRLLMVQDFMMLRGDEFRYDEYILSSISTNYYLSRHVHPEVFDQVCEDMLEHSRLLYAKENGE